MRKMISVFTITCVLIGILAVPALASPPIAFILLRILLRKLYKILSAHIIVSISQRIIPHIYVSFIYLCVDILGNGQMRLLSLPFRFRFQLHCSILPAFLSIMFFRKNIDRNNFSDII